MSETLNAPEAAARLGITLPAVRRLAAEGKLPYSRFNRNILFFAAEDVDAYIERRKVRGKKRDPVRVVYFAQMAVSKHVKIGVATDLAYRINGLKCGNPECLHVLAAIPGGQGREQHLHRAFRHFRLEGEWFRWSDLLGETIARLRDGQDWIDVFDWLEPKIDEYETKMTLEALSRIK